MARRAFSLGLLTAVAMVALLTFGAPAADAQKKGGVLRVGNLGEPPSLDAHWTTASITETLTNHIYEGLFSLDRDNKPIPMLAESYTVSKDGLTYTFKLRQGVKFHNGKEMTSEDVVASLEPLGQAVHLRQGALRPGRRAAGRGPVHRGDEAQGEVGHRADLARGAQQLRGDLSEGDRGEVPARGEGHRVRGHRALQARGVEARPVHPHGPLRRLQVAQREAQRLRRGQDRVARRDPLGAGARGGDPGGAGGDRRARLRGRPEPRRLRPSEGQSQRASDRLQAVLLARGRLQQEGRPDDEPEAAAGLAGRHRHRADHEERGRRQEGVLPDGL